MEDKRKGVMQVDRDNILLLMFMSAPGIILIVGGYLFQKFKESTWNNPLIFFIKRDKANINLKTGQLWLIEGILLLLITFVFKPSIPVLITLYFLAILLSWIIVYLNLKMKKRNLI